MAMFDGMVDELALTAPQKQEMVTLMQMYQPRIKEVVKRGEDSRRALLEMAPDDPAYNVLANEVGQQAGASASEMVSAWSSARRKCKPGVRPANPCMAQGSGTVPGGIMSARPVRGSLRMTRLRKARRRRSPRNSSQTQHS